MKLDSVGHVQKRAGIAIREFRKKKKNVEKLKDKLPVESGTQHHVLNGIFVFKS